MKKKSSSIFTILIIIAIIAWLGRSSIRGLFPPKMKFAATELTVIDNNQPTSIDHFKDKVLIVSCYQTWCIDCARETPVLNQLAGKINSDKFATVYISDEDTGKVGQFRQRFASDKIIFTKSPVSLSNLGISVFPTTFLLNKKGEVVKTKLEGYDWMNEKETIQKLIAQ
jgi:thiol-disulfide isomerase/thioredoxin